MFKYRIIGLGVTMITPMWKRLKRRHFGLYQNKFIHSLRWWSDHYQLVSNHIRLEIPILLVSLDILKQFVEEESFNILDAHHSFFRVTHVLFIFQGIPIDYNNYTRRALEKYNFVIVVECCTRHYVDVFMKRKSSNAIKKSKRKPPFLTLGSMFVLASLV